MRNEIHVSSLEGGRVQYACQRIYLAGPMTGIEDWNFPAFNAAADELRKLGHDVVNPAAAEYMRDGLWSLLTCDAVALLDGWRDSKGAQLEVHVAKALGIPLFRYSCVHGAVGWESRPQPTVYLVPLSPPKLIGLWGYAGAGKDTAARLLQHPRRWDWQPVSFASVLKSMVAALDPIVEANLMRISTTGITLEQAKRQYPEVRRLLQRLGTEAGRDLLGENVWVDIAMSRLHDNGRYVFTDVRFPNEAQAIKDRGGIVISIERPGFGPVNGHASETALEGWPFDYVIANDGDINDLAAKLAEIPEVSA